MDLAKSGIENTTIAAPVIKAIIADDEHRCIANLKYYLARYCPLIQIMATATTLHDVPGLLKTHNPDIAFLDIEMCNDNIFGVLEEKEMQTKIVFVTAYEQYAVRAIKADALDYILKPVSKPDIENCYRKILKRSGNTTLHNQPADKYGSCALQKVILRHREHVYIVRQTDIHYFRAKRFYTEVVFDFNGVILSTLISKPISVVAREHDNALFFRLHKSYLVNIHKVADILKGETTHVRMSNDQLLPVAKRRVNDFLSFLNSLD